MDKVLIAMSGGVDSSVAAFLMKEQGCECIGATMKLFHNEDIGVSRTKTCCSLEDVEDARLVALHLGIPYYVFNFSDDFKGQVIDRFISSYERGATPNPCIDCNRYLKFERLYERARILGCDAIVTGHYARIEQENGRWLLKKSLDESKDQSYVLYSLTQDQLAHTRLPLGAMHKSETRRIAEEQGFYNADKPDSQDICFVPDGDYAGFIARYTGRDCPAGDFVDESGRVLGRHKGIVHYTVGQRKGLGIAADAPLYVKRIDAAENRVVLSGNDALFSRELMANDFNWIAYDVPPRACATTSASRRRQSRCSRTGTCTSSSTSRSALSHRVRPSCCTMATPCSVAARFSDDILLFLSSAHPLSGRGALMRPAFFIPVHRGLPPAFAARAFRCAIHSSSRCRAFWRPRAVCGASGRRGRNAR